MPDRAILYLFLTSGRKPREQHRSTGFRPTQELVASSEIQRLGQSPGFGVQWARLGASAISGKYEELEAVWDHSTHRNVNFSRRAPFRLACETAMEQGATLIVSDLFWMCANMERDEALSFFRRLQQLGVQVIDAKTDVVVSEADSQYLGRLLNLEIREKSIRRLVRDQKRSARSKPHHRTIDLSRARMFAKRAKQLESLRFAQQIKLTIEEIRNAQNDNRRLSLQAFADALNARGIETRRGAAWTPTAVKRVLERSRDAPQR